MLTNVNCFPQSFCDNDIQGMPLLVQLKKMYNICTVNEGVNLILSQEKH